MITPSITSRGKGRVLMVEDDVNVSDVVVRYLERDGFEVAALADGYAALADAQAIPPDLVVLDLMLPGLDGFEVCVRLRDCMPVPIIMLTARGEEDDRILGLELGADDYITKPFSPRELIARVNAVLRRANAPMNVGTTNVIVAHDLIIDVAAHVVTRAGNIISLTVREFDLLTFLASQPSCVFRREELLERVWGYSYGDTATITVHIRRLREKIEEDPSSPRRLVTVWGVGYRFDP